MSTSEPPVCRSRFFVTLTCRKKNKVTAHDCGNHPLFVERVSKKPTFQSMFLCDRLSWTRTIILVKVRLKITMFVGRMVGSRQRRVGWGKACYSKTKGPTSSTSFAQSFATVLKLKIPSHLVTDVTGLPKIPWSQGHRNHCTSSPRTQSN